MDRGSEDLTLTLTLTLLGALSSMDSGVEELTPLGVHLSRLPVDPRVGKLLLIGAAFGPVATNHALTVAASLSGRSPFMSPIDKRDEADRARQRFVDSTLGPSDHIAILNAYDAWDRLRGNEKFSFCRENFLGVRSLQSIGGLKRQLLEILSDGGFVKRGITLKEG